MLVEMVEFIWRELKQREEEAWNAYQKNRDDYDNIPVIRGKAAYLEDGTAVFLGDIDEGSNFIMLNADSKDIEVSTRKTIEQMNAMENINGALIISCHGRFIKTLQLGDKYEILAVKEKIIPNISFSMLYAAGEFCPTSIKNNIPINRFHNYTIVMVIF